MFLLLNFKFLIYLSLIFSKISIVSNDYVCAQRNIVHDSYLRSSVDLESVWIISTGHDQERFQSWNILSLVNFSSSLLLMGHSESADHAILFFPGYRFKAPGPCPRERETLEKEKKEKERETEVKRKRQRE